MERVEGMAGIVEAASRYTTLRGEADGGYVALCPYPDHADMQVLFRVSSKTGYFFCRGCGRGGNASRLVSDLEGGEALAARADTPERAPELASLEARKALAYAARFYEKVLAESNSAGAREAREYLAGRGLNAETLERFGVGYAPSRKPGRGFSGVAERIGIGRATLESAGLIWRRKDCQENDVHGDAFGERITFPISEVRGRTVGFGGRVMPSAPKTYKKDGIERDIPKYRNSLDSELFAKRTLLYGLHQALPSIEEQRAAIVVEGYTDVLMLHQRGMRNAVATLGTVLTDAHLRTLSPFADTLYLLFDPDAAGGDAIVRAYEVALGNAAAPGVPLNIQVAVLDEDPADWLLHHDAHDLRRLLADAKPALLHLLDAHATEVEREHAEVRRAWAKLGAFARSRLYPGEDL